MCACACSPSCPPVSPGGAGGGVYQSRSFYLTAHSLKNNLLDYLTTNSVSPLHCCHGIRTVSGWMVKHGHDYLPSFLSTLVCSCVRSSSDHGYKLLMWRATNEKTGYWRQRNKPCCLLTKDSLRGEGKRQRRRRKGRTKRFRNHFSGSGTS